MTDFANFLRELLGISDYFMISETKKKEYPKKTIEIHLTYSPQVYKVSGKEYRLYDQSPARKWQHLSWFDCTCFIVCSLPSYVDDNGKVKVIAVSFASKGKGYTRLFSQKIIASLLLVKVQKTVATLFQTTPYIVSSIMEQAVENGLDERGGINDFKNISIDEKAYRKGYQYVSILIDRDKDYVMELGEGRAEKDVKALFFSLNSQEEQPHLKRVNSQPLKTDLTSKNLFQAAAQRTCINLESNGSRAFYQKYGQNVLF